MGLISNDQELLLALRKLPAEQQRILAARFAKSVAHLSKEPRVVHAIETGLEPEASADALADAYRAAKSHATKTYAECGRDTNWPAQADHFVAEAAVAALTPDSLLSEQSPNRAWKAAVQARMAVNCASVEDDEGKTPSEMERQYRMAEELLGHFRESRAERPDSVRR
jgi:hypothetical protein